MADDDPETKLLGGRRPNASGEDSYMPLDSVDSRSASSSARVSPRAPPSPREPRDVRSSSKERQDCWLDKLVLVPDRGSRVAHWVTGWEFWTSLITLVCAYLVPFSLALPTVAVEPLFLFNLISDASFTLDLLLQFFLAYRNSEESQSDQLWEKDYRKIARRYCSVPLSDKGQAGWFWLDLLSVLPGWSTILLAGRYDLILKVLRFLRLIRMVRLSRLSRKIEEGQATTGVPFFISDIMKFVFITTFVSHAAACVWVMVESKVTNALLAPGDADQESWLSALRNAKGDCCIPDAEHDPLCVYNLALYWAMMTLTTVGYGDITPQNPLEYLICTLFMLIAGFVWAYIVGSVVSLLSQLDPDNARFKQSMDELNALIEQRNLSAGLRSKLREYMVVAKNIGQVHHQQQLLEDHISGGLQREVVLETPVTQTVLKKVYWAKDLEQDALLEIIRSLKSYVYGKDETIVMRDKMILVREGILAVKGRILGRNEVYGQNSILLTSDHLTDGAMPRTLSFVTLLALTKKALMQVCEQYPSADKRLRVAQIRTAVWRGFIHAAVKEKAAGKTCTKKGDTAAQDLSRRGSFVSAVTRSANLESVVTADELKEVEGRLGQGQRDLTDQLVETRELLNSQMEMMSQIALDMKATTNDGRSSSTPRKSHRNPFG